MRTSDIYFASYINALGKPIKSASKVNDAGKVKTVFEFELTAEDEEKFKTDFFGGTGEVRALAYMYSLRSLKSMCFA